MFKRLFTFWRKPVAPPTARRATAPVPDATAAIPVVRTLRPAASGAGLQIGYHAELIGELQAEHASLLQLYGAIGSAMEQNRWREVSEMLRKLRGMLTGHLLKERVSLYCYLQAVLAEDDDMQALFLSFKVEMGGIGKAAFKFVDRFAAPEVFAEPAMRSAFSEQYAAIGSVLIDRIQREEAQLYPMYQMRQAA